VRKGVSPALIRQIAEAGLQSGAATADALARASSTEIARVNSVQSQVDSVSTATGEMLASRFYDAGIQSARGLVAGLQKEQDAIKKQMLKIAKSMEDALRKALGIRSPSTLFRALGREVPRGFELGIADRAAAPARETSAMARGVARSASVALRPALAGQPCRCCRAWWARPGRLRRQPPRACPPARSSRSSCSTRRCASAVRPAVDRTPLVYG
jgi:hypothetical protein